ncbi:uncharacterized protein LOC129032862 [Pongo pygmaeus]|uniref:uncharacterized protein LOC129032862 n=1 Tax=Pongo pygmaeus TaxID=9600 RepID=UPI0023E09FAA|nr:uncharacterized protein LOC129032862 [Pongo pygmaeus]
MTSTSTGDQQGHGGAGQRVRSRPRGPEVPPTTPEALRPEPGGVRLGAVRVRSPELWRELERSRHPALGQLLQDITEDKSPPHSGSTVCSLWLSSSRAPCDRCTSRNLRSHWIPRGSLWLWSFVITQAGIAQPLWRIQKPKLRTRARWRMGPNLIPAQRCCHKVCLGVPVITGGLQSAPGCESASGCCRGHPAAWLSWLHPHDAGIL